MNRKSKPEALYQRTNIYDKEIVLNETSVVGRAFRFDCKNREVLVDLGDSWIGVIPENEVTVYEFKYSEGKDTPHQVASIIGKQVRAIVTGSRNGRVLILSRRLSMLEAWNSLQEMENVSATIINNVGYGIFLDIGNGLITYCSRIDCTDLRISDTKLHFKKGETLKVKILKKGEYASSWIIGSIKLAYPSLEEAKELINIGDIIAVRIGMNELENGYFCGYSPRISGIIDTEEKLKEGEIVSGYVKKITPIGLKLKKI